VVATGTLGGNIVGGRIAAAASLGTAVLALPTLMWQPGLAWSVALGFAYSFVNASARPSLMATLSDVPAQVRGALFGLNVTMASLGWLLAGSVGALLIAATGFAGIGLFCSALAVLGSLFAIISAGHAYRAGHAHPG
jgi:MFS transporter, DHA1 family, inner membrane transport protein